MRLKQYILEEMGVIHMENSLVGSNVLKSISINAEMLRLSWDHHILHLGNESNRFPSNLYLGLNILASLLQLYSRPVP